MAIRWVEGFDDYTKTTDINMTYLNSVFDHSRLLLGRANYGQSLLFTHLYEPLEFATPDLGLSDTWVIGFAFRPDVSVVAPRHAIVQLRVNSITQVSIVYNPESRTLSSCRSNEFNEDGTIKFPLTGGAGTKQLTLNTWYYVEWRVVVHPTAGTTEIRINEVTDSLGTGITQSGVANQANVVAFSRPQFYHFRFGLDDMYILDDSGDINNDFLGDIKVETLTTIGPGHYTDWNVSNSGLENWEAANSLADGDYVQTNVDKAKDTYTFSPVQQLVDVAAVAVKAYVRNTDRNTHVVEAMLRADDTDYFGVSQSVPEISFRSFMHIQELDPTTGLPWQLSGVNATEFGIRMINTYLITSGGMMNFGGTAPFIFIHTYPPQEGTIGSLQGGADYKLIFTPVTGGNLEIHGEVQTNPFYGSGNLLLQGTADVMPTYLYDASGGLSYGSAAPSRFICYAIGGGTLGLGESADVMPRYRWVASGRRRLIGAAQNVTSNAWEFAASGRLRTGSTSVGMSSYYEYDVSGKRRVRGIGLQKKPTYIYDITTGTLRFKNGVVVVGP